MSNSGDLQQKVLGALVPSERADFAGSGALEIFYLSERPSLEDIETALQKALQEIPHRPETTWEHVSRVIALAGQLHLPGASQARQVLTLLQAYRLSFDGEGDPGDILVLLENDLKQVRHQQKQLHRKSLLGTPLQALDFLKTFYPQGFAKELALAAGVQVSTARRWMREGGMSPASAGRVLQWARAFYYAEAAGLRPKEWWQTPLPSGQTPRDYFQAGWSYTLPAEIRVEIGRLELES